MTKKKTTNKSAPRGSGYNSLLIILVTLILLAIPVFMLGRVVYESYMESGEPIFGDRYKDDLPNEITEAQITNVENAVKGVSDVESVKVNLQSGTLKLSVDLRDDITLEELEEIQENVYNAVTAVLPVNSYFTKTDYVKNYDLEISLFNSPETYDLHSIYVKNSGMAEPKANLVSSPLIEKEDVPEVEEDEGEE